VTANRAIKFRNQLNRTLKAVMGAALQTSRWPNRSSGHAWRRRTHWDGPAAGRRRAARPSDVRGGAGRDAGVTHPNS
jgi:hypothetical protein